MKKLFALAAALVMLLCFSACDKEVPDAPDGYETLNEMLDAAYSRIDLSVTDEIDADTVLHSEYTLLFGETVSVQYSVERLAEIGSLDETLSSEKIVLKGEAKIENGKIALVNGDDIGLSAAHLCRKLSFKEEYFGNAELESMYLKADVKDISGFWGGEADCSDMKVTAVFLDALMEMTVTYRSGYGSAVEIQFTFTI